MALSMVYTTFNGVLVHERTAGGKEREYTSDPLGSLVAYRSDAAGYNYTAEYWPYGEVQTESSTNATRWGFVGLLGYMRDLVNQFYVRARYYRADLLRWMTVDPLWPSTPCYGYTSDPILWTDPAGTQKLCKGCPEPVDRINGDVNADVYTLWVLYRTGGANGVVSKINQCIQNAARKRKIACDAFTPDTLLCLVNSAYNTRVQCSDCHACQPGDCGCNIGKYPKAQIFICYPAVLTKRCGNYSYGHGMEFNLWNLMLHELLHSCGFGHGTGKYPKTCNELATCCIRAVLKNDPISRC